MPGANSSKQRNTDQNTAEAVTKSWLPSNRQILAVFQGTEKSAIASDRRIQIERATKDILQCSHACQGLRLQVRKLGLVDFVTKEHPGFVLERASFSADGKAISRNESRRVIASVNVRKLGCECNFYALEKFVEGRSVYACKFAIVTTLIMNRGVYIDIE